MYDDHQRRQLFPRALSSTFFSSGSLKLLVDELQQISSIAALLSSESRAFLGNVGLVLRQVPPRHGLGFQGLRLGPPELLQRKVQAPHHPAGDAALGQQQPPEGPRQVPP
mmetsp:Transcript_50028/g.100735  ORF Transcript_50028/g.100735 Transcript_50028/m.100735 type:complete len:110 (-) Transcript_50028:57-386(-)